jgi:hypothetical protein
MMSCMLAPSGFYLYKGGNSHQGLAPIVFTYPVVFHNPVMAFELQLRGSLSGGHAACWYSLISPPKTLRRQLACRTHSFAATGAQAWLRPRVPATGPCDQTGTDGGPPLTPAGNSAAPERA